MIFGFASPVASIRHVVALSMLIVSSCHHQPWLAEFSLSDDFGISCWTYLKRSAANPTSVWPSANVAFHALKGRNHIVERQGSACKSVGGILNLGNFIIEYSVWNLRVQGEAMFLCHELAFAYPCLGEMPKGTLPLEWQLIVVETYADSATIATLEQGKRNEGSRVCDMFALSRTSDTIRVSGR